MTGSSNAAVNASGNAGSDVNASGTVNVLALSALEKGANSFTEGQAKSRIASAGFSDVSELKKDDQGVWRGTATRGRQAAAGRLRLQGQHRSSVTGAITPPLHRILDMATRTATALYHNYTSAADAVGKLEAAGIPHDNISIVSNDADNNGKYNDHPGTGAGATFGTVVGGGAGLLAGLGLLAIPGLGPVVAAGWLASTLVGAGVGAAAGGLVGALTDAGIEHGDADAYAEGVRRGGTLVTVRADETQLARATQILDVDGAVDLDERRTAWGKDGWTAGSATTTTESAKTAIADGAARAKDAVERTGARVADAVTPDTRPGMSRRTEPGVAGLGTGDTTGRRVRTY